MTELSVPAERLERAGAARGRRAARPPYRGSRRAEEGLSSRAGSGAAAVRGGGGARVARGVVRQRPHRPPPVGPHRSGAGGTLFEGWARWDAAWYRTIVREGYVYYPNVQSSVAFWPSYPIVVKAFSWLFPSIYITGTVVTLASRAPPWRCCSGSGRGCSCSRPPRSPPSSCCSSTPTATTSTDPCTPTPFRRGGGRGLPAGRARPPVLGRGGRHRGDGRPPRGLVVAVALVLRADRATQLGPRCAGTAAVLDPRGLRRSDGPADPRSPLPGSGPGAPSSGSASATPSSSRPWSPPGLGPGRGASHLAQVPVPRGHRAPSVQSGLAQPHRPGRPAARGSGAGAGGQAPLRLGLRPVRPRGVRHAPASAPRTSWGQGATCSSAFPLFAVAGDLLCRRRGLRMVLFPVSLVMLLGLAMLFGRGSYLS